MIPIKLEGGKLTMAMAEPQNLRVIDELRFKTGRDIVPQFGFHGELRAAIEKLYPNEEVNPAVATPVEPPAQDTEGMEFISSSEQQRNIQVMREM